MASPRTIAVLWATVVVSLVSPVPSSASLFNWSSSASHNSPLPGIELPSHLSFNAVTSSAPCDGHLAAGPPAQERDQEHGDSMAAAAAPPLKLHMKHRSATDPGAAAQRTRRESLVESTHKDLTRIHTFFRRMTERKTAAVPDRHRRIAAELADKAAETAAAAPPELAGRLVATLESGVALGSGEYLMDVFVGTPPRHLSLILDTGSDLNWIQCLPCHDCFPQRGPFFDPAASASYRNVSCSDHRCGLVSPPDNAAACRSSGEGPSQQPCPYFYWYGDRSNTTGDLALEAFTVNLTDAGGGPPESRRVEGVIFGCGHWNRGLFHGAAGLLGLGRGPLSFASQLRGLYGGAFSYCLVDRDSDLTVSSKLIFGEDRSLLRRHPALNYTAFAAGTENPADTFYYVHIKSVVVGGERLEIPAETWELSKDGAGGAIIDSGTTLSYFAEPAYRIIREAFVRKVRGYPAAEDFPVLSPCYNVSGVEKVELPEFAIEFADGAVWRFPPENYFIRIEPEETVCLAILGTPRSSLSIVGNYQQQNFHIQYDLQRSRLGFAPMRCAEA